jgi:inner membrane protein
MFDIVVYVADVNVRARIAQSAWQALRAQAEPGTPVRLRMAVGDTKGIRKLDGITLNGAPLTAQAAGADLSFVQAIEFDLPADFAPAGDLVLEYRLQVAGTRALRVLPLARVATIDIGGTWRDPSYLGAHLPITHAQRDDKFEAHWNVSSFNRSYPQQFETTNTGVLPNASFGVELYQPASVYQQNERSGKYGILVIALVFIAMFLFEIVAGLMLHPIQYLLVGFALALFYLLLLALSEHMGFGIAYAIAGSAAVLLVGSYATAAMRSAKRGITLALLQAGAYGVFFVLVRSEDHALLLGAAVLFVALAAVMYLTRRTDWYGLSGSASTSRTNQEAV